MLCPGDRPALLGNRCALFKSQKVSGLGFMQVPGNSPIERPWSGSMQQGSATRGKAAAVVHKHKCAASWSGGLRQMA